MSIKLNSLMYLIFEFVHKLEEERN